MRKSGISSLTIAPETGSERLRREMHKPLDEARFLERVRELFSQGFEHLKMYFVACLPGEEHDDLDATIALIEKVARQASGTSSVSAAFSIFVPKNHTPWAELQAPGSYEIKKTMKYLKEQLNRLPGSLKVSFESPQEAMRQAYL
ncbi:MAG TPA: B12-binding domain-containing radical SAM protein, partial [Candidatus Rifleibacterium sp.]|nr:B12-binding domain-containing radical SAM protein [Candidatus Rifleibacterium sp.]